MLSSSYCVFGLLFTDTANTIVGNESSWLSSVGCSRNLFICNSWSVGWWVTRSAWLIRPVAWSVISWSVSHSVVVSQWLYWLVSWSRSAGQSITWSACLVRSDAWSVRFVAWLVSPVAVSWSSAGKSLRLLFSQMERLLVVLSLDYLLTWSFTLYS